MRTILLSKLLKETHGHVADPEESVSRGAHMKSNEKLKLENEKSIKS